MNAMVLYQSDESAMDIEAVLECLSDFILPNTIVKNYKINTISGDIGMLAQFNCQIDNWNVFVSIPDAKAIFIRSHVVAESFVLIKKICSITGDNTIILESGGGFSYRVKDIESYDHFSKIARESIFQE
jgi:hypothetical protein